MTTELMGTVFGGRLELDQPLALPDNSRVTVVVRAGAEIPADWRERYIAGLEAWTKLIEERPIHSGGHRFTREELHERH